MLVEYPLDVFLHRGITWRQEPLYPRSKAKPWNQKIEAEPHLNTSARYEVYTKKFMQEVYCCFHTKQKSAPRIGERFLLL